MPLGSQSRDGATVLWICIHTAEGFLGRPDDLYDYFDTVRKGSSHACADDNGLYEWIPYDRAAWTLRDGNNISDNLEMLAMAEWTRAEWLQHRPMVKNAARWAANRCIARGITPRRLTIDQVRDKGLSGIIDHNTYTQATHDGTHWDVGPDFPWDVFMGYVLEFVNGEDDMANSDEILTGIRNVYEVLRGNVPDGHGGYKHDPAHESMSIVTVNARLDRVEQDIQTLLDRSSS